MSLRKAHTYKFFCSNCEEYFDVVVNTSIHNLNIKHSCGQDAVCVLRDEIRDKVHISLTNKDLDRIFKWYDKGFTNIDEDSPLLERLKKHYQEG